MIKDFFLLGKIIIGNNTKIILYKNYINDTMIAFPAIELEVCKIRISQLFQIIVGVDKCIEVMAYRILHRQ